MSKKEVIYSHAVVLFAKKGFSYTSIDDLVHASQTSVGTIYNYFRTKYDILDYIFEKEMQDRAEIFVQMSDPRIAFREKCRRLLQYEMEAYLSDASRSRLLLTEMNTAHEGHTLKSRRIYREKLQTIYTSLVSHALNNGEIREVPDSLVTSTLLSMHLMIPLYGTMLDGGMAPAELSDTLLDIVFNGIA